MLFSIAHLWDYPVTITTEMERTNDSHHDHLFRVSGITSRTLVLFVANTKSSVLPIPESAVAPGPARSSFLLHSDENWGLGNIHLEAMSKMRSEQDEKEEEP